MGPKKSFNLAFFFFFLFSPLRFLGINLGYTEERYIMNVPSLFKNYIYLFLINWWLLYILNKLCCVLRCFSRVPLFATLWTVALQAPLSMGFFSKNNKVGCHILLQGIFPTQDLTHLSYVSCMGGGFFTTSTTWEAPLILLILSKWDSWIPWWQRRINFSRSNYY